MKCLSSLEPLWDLGVTHIFKLWFDEDDLCSDPVELDYGIECILGLKANF